ncbi:hypothetical protein Agabi119p4_4604 [Agaricus bisporus var. burnettii]|uniref:4'-phosphopantetheinyl transferase domain-containing protein n=1 Tax=Agaricus bisporus var. burnettii TaxID=192524 RepID=A0A8H7F3L0_AGABI|nr:hypothetical protein Agabi119p4_4604 [Agaricus bisporus var. burnettii]
MILGIGVDIVLLPRIAALVKRRSGEKLARRILSPPEFKDWKRFQGIDDQHRVRFLAVRWAVKEAAYKALYPTVKPTWKELCYQGLNEAREKPSLLYQPHSSLSSKEIIRLHVSVSHDGDYTTAFVVIEGNFPT